MRARSDRRFDLRAVAHDPGILQQLFDAFRREARDGIDVEIRKGFDSPRACSDRRPRQPGLRLPGSAFRTGGDRRATARPTRYRDSEHPLPFTSCTAATSSVLLSYRFDRVSIAEALFTEQPADASRAAPIRLSLAPVRIKRDEGMAALLFAIGTTAAARARARCWPTGTGASRAGAAARRKLQLRHRARVGVDRRSLRGCIHQAVMHSTGRSARSAALRASTMRRGWPRSAQAPLGALRSRRRADRRRQAHGGARLMIALGTQHALPVALCGGLADALAPAVPARHAGGCAPARRFRARRAAARAAGVVGGGRALTACRGGRKAHATAPRRQSAGNRPAGTEPTLEWPFRRLSAILPSHVQSHRHRSRRYPAEQRPPARSIHDRHRPPARPRRPAVRDRHRAPLRGRRRHSRRARHPAVPDHVERARDARRTTRRSTRRTSIRRSSAASCSPMSSARMAA